MTFLHSLNKYVLNIYFVSDIGLDVQSKVVKKTRKNLFPIHTHVLFVAEEAYEHKGSYTLGYKA